MLSKFGKPTEITAAHIQTIPSLPFIQNSHTNQIHDLYKKLVISVQALDSMNRLKEINGYVRLTLDKLSEIRVDLVRIDEDWQKWTFSRLVDALRKWTTRNMKIILCPEKGFKHENAYQKNDKNYKDREPVTAKR